MKITRDVIAHLERLARIELSPEEVGLITEQLDRIVRFVEKLQAVDVTGVPPTRLMSQGDDPMRDDEVTPGLDRRVVLAQAPDGTEEFFRVPRVIGRDEEA